MLELLNSRVEDENNIISYLNKITDLKNKLEELKKNSIDDALLLAIIVSKLLATFATFQTIYGRDKVMEAETFDWLKNLILAEDVKLKHHEMLGDSDSSQPLAMKTQRKEAAKEEKITQRLGESSQYKKKFNGKCNYCKKDGHHEKNYWFKRHDKRKVNQDDKGKSVAAHCIRAQTLSAKSDQRHY